MTRTLLAAFLAAVFVLCGLWVIYFLFIEPQSEETAAEAPGQSTEPWGQQALPAAPAQQQLSLVYTPWRKICGKDPKQVNAQEECLLIKEARQEAGELVASATLMEAENKSRKILRITLPLGMRLEPGTRVIIDRDAPIAQPYLICMSKGCVSDYDADADLVGKMRKAQEMILQGVTAAGQPVSLRLQLGGFAEAYDGPPTDLKVLEEQKRLEAEVERRARDVRNNPEIQPQTPNGRR